MAVGGMEDLGAVVEGEGYDTNRLNEKIQIKSKAFLCLFFLTLHSITMHFRHNLLESSSFSVALQTKGQLCVWVDVVIKEP